MSPPLLTLRRQYIPLKKIHQPIILNRFNEIIFPRRKLRYQFRISGAQEIEIRRRKYIRIAMDIVRGTEIEK
ncbi:hypothetical protein NHQ30_005256 [Ciborinia camelliae]|nr:hypothetical protein NHQ30_005256 [Ciborinia camelliae]